MRSWFRRKASTGEEAPEPAAAPPVEETTTEAQAAAAPEEAPKAQRRSTPRSRKPRQEKEPAPSEETPAVVEAAAPAKPAPQKRERRRRAETPRRSTLPPVRKEMLVSVDVGEQRVAVLEDGRPVEVYLERPGRRSIAGNIYKGVVDNVLPGMEASFIDIGLEKSGFLYVDEIVAPELEGKRHGRRIQDLVARGQRLLVQAVKDPMGTKGARLTTEISLPGRFIVYTPFGDGVGVSRRLEDDERERLKKLCKGLDLPEGGIIVRTAAEGVSEEELTGDLAFLQKLWATIQARAERADVPTLVYREAELPLRVVRDLFVRDFEHLTIDDERAYARIVSYLRRTSPSLAEKVELYRDAEPLMERFGVDAAVRSTLDRRVDLPSGGYLIFDYAEAFTVIDVNTGRFVGARGRSSTARLEDTITKNNLEATKEIVRQLRLRDIGGIIVIDFIDMANPKNRHEVEEALKRELERDRTKTYVVEISPLGLVEMTRQNVTDGPREILTCRCPACEGNGVVVSDETHAVDAERSLRRLVRGSSGEALVVEVAASVAGILIGPAGSRLAELERETGRTLAFEARDDVSPAHVAIVAEGTVDEIVPKTLPVSAGQQLRVLLEEANLRQPDDAIARLDGYVVSVTGAAKKVGKRATIRIERVTRTAAYAVLVDAKAVAVEAPVEAGVLAEADELEAAAAKPRRRRAARPKAAPAAAPAEPVEAAEPVEESPETAAATGEGDQASGPEEGAPKKKTRRGSRGGRGRKKPAATGEDASAATEETVSAATAVGEPATAETAEPATEVAAEAEAATPRPRTRRGSRGGRGRKKPAAASAASAADAGEETTEAVASEPDAPAAAAGDPAGDGEPGTAPAETPGRRTRRGSRGGQGRRKPSAAGAGPAPEKSGDREDAGLAPEKSEAPGEAEGGSGETNGAVAPARRTRRGSRGGRGRKRATGTTAGDPGADGAADGAPPPRDEPVADAIAEGAAGR